MRRAPTRLVVNADDLGLHPALDAGILRAHREGIVTSATVLVSGPNAEEAVDKARAQGLALGVHLALLSLLESLPPGDFELGCHPGEGHPRVPEDPGWTYGWQSELEALTSPRVRARVEALGVELTTYARLAEPSAAVASAT